MPKILWKNQPFSWRISKVLITSYIFTKIWDLEILTMERQSFLKKWKNYAFWWLILTNVERKNFEFFEFVKYGLKYFDSERSWYILAQITGSRTSYSRSEIFVKKYKIIRLFHILYKNGSFFHRSLLKTEIVKVNKGKIEN